jgi:hypothetical protein
MRRTFAGLLHQQCWLWGCDIRRPAGNLLIDYGARRRPPASGRPGTSSYEVALDARTTLHLWGFGVALARQDGPSIFVGRYDVAPAAVHDPAALARVWHVADLPPRAPYDTPPGWWPVARVAEWIGDYEAWVAAEAGHEWRERCLHGFEAAVTTASTVAATWWRFGDTLRQDVLRAAAAPGLVRTRSSRASGQQPVPVIAARLSHSPGART